MSAQDEGHNHEQSLRQYLTYGGMPQATTMESDEQRKSYLQDLFTGTYLKDIKERYSLRDNADMEELMDVLASSVGSLVNPTKLRNTFLSVKKNSITVILSRHISTCCKMLFWWKNQYATTSKGVSISTPRQNTILTTLACEMPDLDSARWNTPI
mgnify:CR=1 FL=1